MAYRKPNRAGLSKAKAAHDEWLRSMGINPDKKPSKRNLRGVDLPDLSCSNANTIRTSDKICGHGAIKETQSYTGDELLGITLLHKSSYEPIRKDNKQAAVAAAQMRRN